MDESSLSTRLDEVEQELVRLLSLRADDLQIFSSRQDQLIQSHYHSISSSLLTAQKQLQILTSSSGLDESARKEIRGRWIERRNLKHFLVFCEEIQRHSKTFNSETEGLCESNSKTNSYQTPNVNDSSTNLSTISTTSTTSINDLSELSLN